jgi:hypothetical protein
MRHSLVLAALVFAPSVGSHATARAQYLDEVVAGLRTRSWDISAPTHPERVLSTGLRPLASSTARNDDAFGIDDGLAASVARAEGRHWSAGRGAKWGFFIAAGLMDAAIIADGSADGPSLVLGGAFAGLVGGGVGAGVGSIAGAVQSHRASARLATADGNANSTPPNASTAQSSTAPSSTAPSTHDSLGGLAGILVPGQRVRVWASNPPMRQRRATITSISADSLVLQEDEIPARLAIPIQSLEALEINRGEGGSKLESAILGATIGGLVGAVAGGGIAYATLDRPICRSGASDVCGLGTLLGVFLGGGLGAVIGTVHGVRSASEHWEAVPLPLRVGVSHKRRSSAITVSATFR